MSEHNVATAEQSTDHQTDETPSQADDLLEFEAQLEVLQAENDRLRNEYARTRQAQYQNTAFGLLAVGVVAFIGGGLFPDTREVFIVIGATGIFAGILTYYLTPGKFVAASVGERVYSACATRCAALTEELGLQSEFVYVPGEGGESAKLFVPLDATYDIPHEPSGPLILESGERGLLIETTGGALFTEFTRTLSGELGTSPTILATQLCDGLVEGFELAAGAEPDIDAQNERITVAVSESAYGEVDRFDHPVSSFLAVGFAIGLDQPVSVEVTQGNERSDWLVTCRFDSGEVR